MALGSDLLLKLIITAQDKTGAAMASAREGIQSINTIAQKVWDATKAYFAYKVTVEGVDRLKEGLLAILSTGGEFERYAASLTALMGSVAAGKQAFEWIKQFAKGMPFELDGVTKAFIKMKAFGLDPMDGSLKAIAEQTAKMGGGQEELAGIVLALGQAWSKQVLQAEEANQMLERGVPVWDMLAKIMGKSTAELMELAEAGSIGRKEIKALIDEMGRSSEGALEAQMKTWNGLVSNLSDSWTQFLNTIAESGALDFFKSKVEAVNAAFSKMAASGELQQKAQVISDAFVGIGTVVSQLAGWAAETGKYWRLAGTYVAEYYAIVEAIQRGKAFDLSKITQDFAAQREEILKGTEASNQKAAADAKLAETQSHIASGLLTSAEAMQRLTGETPRLASFREEWAKLSTGTKEAKEAWDKYLKTVQTADLAKVIEEARAHIEQLGPVIGKNADEMRQWQGVIDSALRESLTRAGLDAEQALTGVGAETRKGIAEFENLRKSLDAAGTDGKKAGAIVQQAFTQLIGKAKTKEEFEALRKVMTDTAKTGVIGADALTNAYRQLAQAADKASASEQERAASASYRAEAERIASQASANERMQHEAAVAAQRRQNAAEAQAQSQAQRAADAATMHDGEQVTLMYSSLGLEFERFGERGRQALKAIEDGLGLGKYQFSVWNHAAATWITQADAQLAKVEQLTEALQEATKTGVNLSGAITSAGHNFDKLDKVQLEGLNQALEAAKQRLSDIEDSTKSTLQGLEDRLLELDASEAEIAKRRAQREREKLQADLKTALDSGNQQLVDDAQKALGLLDKIQSKEAAKAKQDAQAEKANADKARREERDKALAESAARAQASPAAATSAQAGPSPKVVEVVEVKWGGETVSLLSNSKEAFLRGIARERASSVGGGFP